MTIRKIKNRRLYDIGTSLIIILLVYVILTHLEYYSAKDLLTLLFLGSSGQFAFRRAYELDKLRRIISQQELVDSWLYANQTSQIKLFIDYFFIYPLRQRYDNVKQIKKINTYTYLTYITLALFCLTEYLL
jgi:hypothetical protein